MDVSELFKKLEEQRNAYQYTLKQVQDAIGQAASLSSPPDVPLTMPSSPVGRHFSQQSITFSETDSRRRDHDRRRKPSFPESSALSISDEDSDDASDESLYVQAPLPPRSFDLQDLREHLKSYSFDEHTTKILHSVVSDKGRLQNPSIFPGPKDKVDRRTEFSQFQIFDVGVDGAPLEVHPPKYEEIMGKEMAIWHAIKDLNSDEAKERKAVGRITIAREPSPVMFAALHHTYNSSFHMDRIFEHLVDAEASSAYMNHPFHEDDRRQRSFVFNFEYYTIIADECQPMDWQLSDKQTKKSDDHIPVSRCSCVVALSLSGNPLHKVKNPGRRVKRKSGYVYDPWAPWELLVLQAYPDWRSTAEGHDSSKHYVNGPEAFMTVLLTEFKDAQKRYEDIYKRITKLVTPPQTFIFDSDLREKLLFEDKDFTYSKRYFWAFQTLGTMNDSIKALVDSYEDTFTDDVWDGTNKTIWPMVEGSSARTLYYKKKMQQLKRRFEEEMKNFKDLMNENDGRRREIRSLRDQLFSGTSVLESRKSVDLAGIAIEQNYNIKVLTLVNIFFLPLTFVTSVFGMTNMPTEHHFWMFGIVVVAVCVPFFLLIGSLNTTSGYDFWRNMVYGLLKTVLRWFRLLSGKGKKASSEEAQEGGKSRGRMERSLSAKEGIAARRRGNMAFGLYKTTSSDSTSGENLRTSNGRAEKEEDGGGKSPTQTTAGAQQQAPEVGNDIPMKAKEDHITMLDRLMKRKRGQGSRADNV